MDVLLRWDGIWWGSEEVEGAGERRGVCSAMVYGGQIMVCCDERCRRWPIYSVLTNYILFRKAYLYITHFVIQLEMAICLSTV